MLIWCFSSYLWSLNITSLTRSHSHSPSDGTTTSRQVGITTHACSHTDDGFRSYLGVWCLAQGHFLASLHKLAQSHLLLGSGMEPISLSSFKNCLIKWSHPLRCDEGCRVYASFVADLRVDKDTSNQFV